MLDFSAAFRKIKNGKYHFFPGTVFSSKAYIVTYNEKGMIIKIIYSSFQKALCTTMPGMVLSFINIKLFLSFMLFMFFIILFDYKRNIRKILGNRELVITEPLGLVNQINRKANKMTKDDFKTSLRLFLLSLGWLAFLIHTIFVKKKYDFITVTFFLFLIIVLVLFFTFIILFLKKNLKG